MPGMQKDAGAFAPRSLIPIDTTMSVDLINTERPLPLDRVEAVRFRHEIPFADALARMWAGRASVPTAPPPPDRIRRELLAGHVRLSETMAPEVFAAVRGAALALEISLPVEVYQAAGEENAANRMCQEEIFVTLQGKLVSLLDAPGMMALLGHELGHHLAHTDPFAGTPRQEALRVAGRLAVDAGAPRPVRVAASRLTMAMEFTADRFAALAAGSLEGPVRLLMSVVTGLPAVRLTADPEAYLAQARALFEEGRDGKTATVGSHPEHLLRAWALSLFGETDLFRERTGSGSGRLTMDAVDAALERILTGNDDAAFDPAESGPLPPEVQEFSLCASVLLATADGELAEPELELLELTFADVVTDWKDYLSADRATGRFGELLPLMLASGRSAALSIFHVLIHLMLADREVHVRELELLAWIGRALGEEALFQVLLSAVARTVVLQRTEKVVERPMPVLPPGRREAGAALDALLAAVARRGGGPVVWTRLLRILGLPRWTPELLEVVTRAAARHGLGWQEEPLLEQGKPGPGEGPAVFLPFNQQTDLPGTDAAPAGSGLAQAGSRDALVVALKNLRERLVGGDGRSPSVRLYRTAAGRHFDLAQIDRLVPGRAERIAALLPAAASIPLLSGAEAGSHKSAGEMARTIRNLDRESRARVEETGARDLFVGYPFLTGMAGGFFVRAPLVLYPFSLAGDSRGGASYTLKRRGDEPAMANQALLRLLFAKRGLPFTEELALHLDNKAAESPESLLEALRELGLGTAGLSGMVRPFEEMNAAAALLLPDGLEVAEHAVVGFFPQSSSDLLQDYDELLEKLDTRSPAALGPCLNAACELLPAGMRPGFAPPAMAEAAADQPVIYADPSQRAAVQLSRSCRLLVMDGPPGTGKSQTIVNLVADTLARGGKVAIVCEKRVALDVVQQRLAAAGLGHLTALVHDVHDDRKALYQHIADRLEPPERRRFDPARMETLRREAGHLESQLGLYQAWLALPVTAGFSLGRLYAMASSFDAPAVAVEGMERLEAEALPGLTGMVKAVHPLARLFAEGSPFRTREGMAMRPSLTGATPGDLAGSLGELRAAHGTAVRFAEAYARMPLPLSALESAQAALVNSVSLAGRFVSGPYPGLAERMIGCRRDSAAAAAVEQAFGVVETHRAAALEAGERIEFRIGPEFAAAIAIVREHHGSWFRFLRPSWRRAGRIIRENLLRQWPEEAGDRVTPERLAAWERRDRAGQAWQAAAELFTRLGIPAHLPGKAEKLSAQLPGMTALWQDAGALLWDKPALAPLALWPLAEGADGAQGAPVDWAGWGRRCQQAVDLWNVRMVYSHAAAAAARWFPHAAGLDPAGLLRLAEAFETEAAALEAADRILHPVSAQLSHVRTLVEKLADTLPDAPSFLWADAVLRGWAERLMEITYASNPELAHMVRSGPPCGSERASARLLELHQAMAAEESLRLAARADAAGLMAVNPAEARVRRSPEQATREMLIRECRKQRNVMPLRTLVRKTAGSGLLDVVPVWLMSPETTAVLFPREPVFDLLIIDEASQCTVENGLPVLTRARQAVVAGDDKQMPPTSFFKAATRLEASVEEDSEAEVSPDNFEAESLLVLARQGAAGAPLRWHYRALFEELIAFSNHSMYGGSLLTIPSVRSRSAPSAVRWVRLEDGVWDGGANQPEARRVVDLIAELLERPVPPSIGVVTFNLVQRRAILDEIDARRTEDAAFCQRYDEAAGQESLDLRPFVKNIESVQGDERDVILFSLGHAPVLRMRKDGTEERYVPARFGPVGQKGGERRLNVAVSRAKAEIIVVSSFDPAMLSVARAKHDGPRLFKAFVEFVRHLGEGRHHQAATILNLVNDTRPGASPGASAGLHSSSRRDGLFLPLHQQIFLALEAAGYPVEEMIGSSEFRLPVALVHPQDAHCYSLAILCDDGTGGSDVFADFVHVPNVLAHRQWKYLRVNSRDWHLDRAGVMARIRAAM